MSIQIKSKYLFLAVLIAFVGIFALGRYCGHKGAERTTQSAIIALKDTISSYKYKVGALQKIAFERDQLITTQREAIKRGEIERQELKALNLKYVNEISVLTLQVDTLMTDITHNGTIIIVQQNTIDSLTHVANTSNNKKNAILLPFSFNKSDKWLSLKGGFDKDGKLDVGLKLTADVDVFTGLDKKSKQYKSVVVTDCPYISVLNIRSQKFDLKKPTRWGIGLNAGYGIILDKDVHLAPYLGAGISYDIFSF